MQKPIVDINLEPSVRTSSIPEPDLSSYQPTGFIPMAPSKIPFPWVPAPQPFPEPALTAAPQVLRCSNWPQMLNRMNSSAIPIKIDQLTLSEVEQLRIWFPNGIIQKEALLLIARITEANSRDNMIEPEMKKEITCPYRINPRHGTERKTFPFIRPIVLGVQPVSFDQKDEGGKNPQPIYEQTRTEDIFPCQSQTIKVETNEENYSSNVIEEAVLPEPDYNPQVILEFIEVLGKEIDPWQRADIPQRGMNTPPFYIPDEKKSHSPHSSLGID